LSAKTVTMSKSPTRGKSDVLSRLTDTSKYTGAHKARFDKDGKGMGAAGRDMGNEGKVTDLSQMTRSAKGGSKSPGRSERERSPVRSKSPKKSTSSSSTKSDKKESTESGSGSTSTPTETSNGNDTEKKEKKEKKETKKSTKKTDEKEDDTSDKSKKEKSSGDIVSRLTDSSKYSGMYKARFDEKDSKGGDAGSVKKSGTVSGVSQMEVKKFGTQAAVAKKITIWQNGDKHHKGVVITLSKHISTFQALLEEATKKLTITTGAAAKFWSINKETKKFNKVTKLEDIKDGEHYLVGGAEKIAHDKLPATIFD